MASYKNQSMLLRATKFWLALVFYVVSNLFSIANAGPIEIKSKFDDAITLGSHYQLVIDPDHAITINDILAPHSTVEFQPLTDGKFNLGYRPQIHWFKVEIINMTAEDLHRLLEFHFPLLDELTIYIINTASKRIISQFNAGDMQTFNSRAYIHQNFVFPLTLTAHSNLSLYFQIYSEGSMTSGATLWSPAKFMEQSHIEYFYMNLYLGLLIGLLFYNFLLYLSIRETSFLYYSLFSGSMLLAVGSFNGLWFQLLWPGSPHWHQLSSPVFFSLAGIFAALFSRAFLQTYSDATKLDKTFCFVAITFGFTLVASPFVSLLYIAPLISIGAIALAATSITAGTLLSLRGNRSAQIYLLSWVIFMLGTALFSARNIGWVPSNTFTHYGIIFGSALEMILLSFALAQRINFHKEESRKSKQQAFQTHSRLIEVLRESEDKLSQRVKNRTEALVLANKKLREQEEFLKKLAHHDPLTGLANRMLITEQIDLALTRCKREKSKLAVLFLDLDGFKAINDKFGHKAGDDLLIATADNLRHILRDSDVIGRLGGDEFIILLESSTDEIDTDQIISKIKKTISQPVMSSDITMRVNVSIGSALYPDDGHSADELISASDAAMYVDKGYRLKTNSVKTQ